MAVVCSTGKSLSEALIFASTNPQYEELLTSSIHENSKLKTGEYMMCTEIVSDIQNNFCTQHVLPMFCKKRSFWQRFTCIRPCIWIDPLVLNRPSSISACTFIFQQFWRLLAYFYLWCPIQWLWYILQCFLNFFVTDYQKHCKNLSYNPTLLANLAKIQVKNPETLVAAL